MRWWWLAVAALGCAQAESAVVTPGAAPPGRVSVAVAREDCDEVMTSDDIGYRAELDLRVAVANGTRAPVHVRPADLRAVRPGEGEGARPLLPGAPFDVAPGAVAETTVTFFSEALDCDAPIHLFLASAPSVRSR